MEQIEIKSRWSGKVLVCGKYESIKECLEKNRCANLRRANLEGADLRGADLRRANLEGADLRVAKYKDEELKKAPIQISNIGYYVMIIGSYIKIGCEEHKQSEWWKFTDKEIIVMDGKKALEWWKLWKPILKKMCKEYNK